MVKIITDSAADFEPWELEKQDIACIPLTVIFGDREYQENVNLSKEQFYDLLAKEEGAPKTAQASPAVVGELFQQARQEGEEAVYITLSAALSGTYQGACMAREMAGKTGIYVVDSKNATGGQRLLVEYAVRLRDEGKPASEIAAGVEALRDAGLCLEPLRIALDRANTGKVVSNLLASVWVALISLLCVLAMQPFGVVMNLDKVIIGGIIPLVPGIALTTGIRDIAGGDYLSGTIRAIDAMLIGGSIALGVGLVLKLSVLMTGVTI